MDSYPVSQDLLDLLDRQGLLVNGTAIPSTGENKGPGAATDRARRQVARHEGGDMHGGGIRLVWSQATTMRKTAGRKTSAAFLMIEGGKL